MEVSNEVVFNTICDFRKKAVDDIEKAKLIKAYMTEHNFSLRTAAAEFGIPKTTLQNWLCFLNITKEQYKELENKGFSHTQITNAVRRNDFKRLLNSDKPQEFDKMIEDIINKLKPYAKLKPEFSSQTSILLSNLRQTIQSIEKNIHG